MYIFTSGFGPSLFFLAGLLVRDEDTYGEVPALRAILVLHQDAVLAAVRRVDAGDEEVGELARLELEDDVPVRCDLLVVLQPGDLRHGVTRDVAGQTESLREETDTVKKKNQTLLRLREDCEEPVYLPLLYGHHVRQTSSYSSTTCKSFEQ